MEGKAPNRRSPGNGKESSLPSESTVKAKLRSQGKAGSNSFEGLKVDVSVKAGSNSGEGGWRWISLFSPVSFNQLPTFCL